MPDLSSETIAKLKARAADPARRTGTAAFAARSISPLDIIAKQRSSLASRSPEFQAKVREYIEHMNSPLSGMISNAVTGDGSQAARLLGLLARANRGKPVYAKMGDQVINMGAKSEPSTARAPLDATVIAWAEGELGFSLPSDLKAFYTQVADGEVGPGGGIYPISGLIQKWREVTQGPVGPQDQDWPRNLLPILGGEDLFSDELFSIDLDHGRIVYWDVNELDIEDDTPADDPSWASSFKPVAGSLEEWLAAWAQ